MSADCQYLRPDHTGGSGALIAKTFVTESYTAVVPLNRGRGLDGEAVVAAGGSGAFTRCPCPYHGGGTAGRGG